jgi:sugar lactone lactonase YvrE
LADEHQAVNIVSGPTTILAGLEFPEGPRWHDGHLWFSDINGHAVRSIDEHGETVLVIPLDDSPSGLGFMPNGDLLIVLMHRRVILRRSPPGLLTLHADLSAMPGDFINDMVVDEQGGAYVGTRTEGIDPENPGFLSDSLVYVSPDGAGRVVAQDLVAPNGAVLTGDGRLLLSETYAHRLMEFTIAPDASLRERRIFVEIDGIYPDGICADPAGGIWIASPYNSELLRVDQHGVLTDRIATGEFLAVACAFGGALNNTLFVVSVSPATMRKVRSEVTQLFIFDPDAPSGQGSVKTFIVRPQGSGS